MRGAGISPAAAGDRGRCPLDPCDLGCPPPVGKRGRRGILRQGKVWVRRHTGCMARSRTAAMAEKARRAPQTYGWWTALTRKKSSKTFIVLDCYFDLVQCRRICAVRFSIHAPHCCAGRASGPSAPPAPGSYGLVGRHRCVPPSVRAIDHTGRGAVWARQGCRALRQILGFAPVP